MPDMTPIAAHPRGAGVGLAASFHAANAALALVSKNVTDYRALDDAALLELGRVSAVQQQYASTHGALIAGEIARRSHHTLGHAGLAQRTGYRTPVELVRATTGVRGQDAAAAVQVGVLLHQAQDAGTVDAATGEIATPDQPWLDPVARAVTAHGLSVAAARSIANGLGQPNDLVSSESLTAAATQLCAEAEMLDADRLFVRARQLRDEIDAAGIGDREKSRHDARYFRIRTQPDGMVAGSFLLDGEAGAYVLDAYDRATSPRRGGPRFTPTPDAISADATSADAPAGVTRQPTLAEQIVTDTRTTEQLAADVFVELLRRGAEGSSDLLLGTGGLAVRVLVTENNLHTRTGAGHIEGNPDPVGINTVARHICTDGYLPVVLDENGKVLDLGREKRLFSRQQKIALAARDGGCMHGDCEKPPSWCEAHHINFWQRDHGETNILDGILLCQPHHLMMHNNGWEIVRRDDPSPATTPSGMTPSGATHSDTTHSGATYWMIPPPNIDPEQKPIPMKSKSKAWHEHMRQGRAS